MKKAIQQAMFLFSALSLLTIGFVPSADAAYHRHYRTVGHYRHHHSMIGSAINLASQMGTTYLRYRMSRRYNSNPYAGGYGNPYYAPNPTFGYNPYGRPW